MSKLFATLRVQTMSHNNPQISYTLALRKLLSLSDYERMAGIRQPRPKLGLSRIEELLSRVECGRASARTVHIAGTKGKGSVAAMVASVLKASGLHVGLFTSPHLHHFRERIRIDGEPVSEREFSLALDDVWPHINSMQGHSSNGSPTTFEALTVMALRTFQRHGVDVNVIEVGLGGRLDSTNVVYGDVAVVTHISLDHTDILGDSIASIAAEKAGIIKPGSKAVIAPQVQEAMGILERIGSKVSSTLWRVGEEVTYKAGSNDLSGQSLSVQTPRGIYQFEIPLLGVHQQENAATAVAAIDALGLGITESAIVHGMRSVKWAGRFQILSTRPYLVVDGAHNEYSISRLCQTIKDYIPCRRVTVLFGCSMDKDLDAMANQLSQLVDDAAVCISRHPRAMPPDTLQHSFQILGVPTRLVDSVAIGLKSLMDNASPDDLVIVTGSLFVVAEALEAWYGIDPEIYPELQTNNQSIVEIGGQEGSKTDNG
jgi:dihydrofolate synthase/folylpolyglutamate synthase